MSTVGIIGRLNEATGGFRGVGHHWDGDPCGLGRALWQLYHGRFNKYSELMLALLIDAHPAGWSTILNKDWSKEIGFGSDGGPECYCHGLRSEKACEWTEEDSGDADWAYIFDGKVMSVIRFGCDGEERVAKVCLDGQEPDWSYLEKRLARTVA